MRLSSIYGLRGDGAKQLEYLQCVQRSLISAESHYFRSKFFLFFQRINCFFLVVRLLYLGGCGQVILEGKTSYECNKDSCWKTVVASLSLAPVRLFLEPVFGTRPRSCQDPSVLVLALILQTLRFPFI